MARQGRRRPLSELLKKRLSLDNELDDKDPRAYLQIRNPRVSDISPLMSKGKSSSLFWLEMPARENPLRSSQRTNRVSNLRKVVMVFKICLQSTYTTQGDIYRQLFGLLYA